MEQVHLPEIRWRLRLLGEYLERKAFTLDR